MIYSIIALAVLGFFSQPSLGSNVERWTFKSKGSSFNIHYKNNKYLLNGKSVSSKRFTPFEKLFDPTQVYEECIPPKRAPDVTITAHTLSDQKVSRFFYFKEKLVSFANQCLTIKGLEIYRTPSSPAWFTEPNPTQVKIKNHFKLKLADMTIEYQKMGKNWGSTDSAFYTHWSFFNSFIEAFKNSEVKDIYNISLVDELSKAPQFKIEIKNITYHFFEVASGVWGLASRNNKYFTTFSNWGILSQLSLDRLKSSHFDLLKKMSESPSDEALLTSAIKQITPTWNQDIKKVYLTLLGHEKVSDSSRLKLFKEVKKHPSKDVLQKLTVVFLTSKDLILLSKASRILRIQYPKGPLIHTKDSLEMQQKELRYWEDLALKNK